VNQVCTIGGQERQPPLFLSTPLCRVPNYGRGRVPFLSNFSIPSPQPLFGEGTTRKRDEKVTPCSVRYTGQVYTHTPKRHQAWDGTSPSHGSVLLIHIHPRCIHFSVEVVAMGHLLPSHVRHWRLEEKPQRAHWQGPIGQGGDYKRVARQKETSIRADGSPGRRFGLYSEAWADAGLLCLSFHLKGVTLNR
jgi:hypothetical protein